MTAPPATPARNERIDVARGALLAAMVLVHVVSAHAAGNDVTSMRSGFAVLLVSAGFVTLSGWVAGMKDRARGDLARAAETAAQLLLVMLAGALVFSLLRHGLALAAGGDAACRARAGWEPPRRLDDLGILLPIALVQLQAPLARRGAAARALLAAIAAGWALLPLLLAGAPDGGAAGWVAGVLTRRTLTPFYTVSSFVAFGLAGALLARTRLRALVEGVGRPAAAAALAASLLLAYPPVEGALQGAAQRASPLAAAAASVLHWVVASLLFLCGAGGAGAPPPGAVARAFALLGRRSLLVFVVHGALLELDAFARDASGAPKGLAVALSLAAANLLLLAIVAAAVERRPALRAAASALLLERRPGAVRARAFGFSGAAALLVALAGFGAPARAEPGALVLDRFEDEACPRWWTFGDLVFRREPAPPGIEGRALVARGRSGGPFASGTGLYVDRDLGGRSTFVLDVRGEGPRSGALKIELCEDDDGNWEIEKDAAHVPIRDDRFVHEVAVDWDGWRTLVIPAAAHRDDNAGGNGRFDPERDLTSGGLLEVQLLFAAAPGEDEVRIALAAPRWTP